MRIPLHTLCHLIHFLIIPYPLLYWLPELVSSPADYFCRYAFPSIVVVSSSQINSALSRLSNAK